MVVKNLDIKYSQSAIIQSISKLVSSHQGSWIFNLANLSLRELDGSSDGIKLEELGLNGVSEDIPDDPAFYSIFDAFEQVRVKTQGFHIGSMWVLCVNPKSVSRYIESLCPYVVLPLVVGYSNYMVPGTVGVAEKLFPNKPIMLDGKFALLNGNESQRAIILGVSLYELHQ